MDSLRRIILSLSLTLFFLVAQKSSDVAEIVNLLRDELVVLVKQKEKKERKGTKNEKLCNYSL
jgi:hypothetical protein